ncbi:hypothetical protein SOCE26_005850 [Sorangium cellulosum]|uniref:DUF4139 domain-containing protein n=1 Tax=Sorangium cellulosum TaxID=56 RepID=A0A2L0EIS7_SORCE|nr:DUF4139 domain-containing protein [Sorangium cellulosum]AUX39203.1 hypothetical protein SOCE26_005850 [Sorangium cellulosum]
MAAEKIECASRIEGVVVYARGAVVTRRVELATPLPRGAVELSVPGVTLLAEPGSFRALVAAKEGPPDAAGAARDVLGVQARLVVPPAPASKSSLSAQLRARELAIERLSAEQTHLHLWREHLGAVSLDPALARRFRPGDPAARLRDALAVSGLLSGELAALDARIAALDAALERARKELTDARLDAAQATSAEVEEKAPPRLEVVVRLAPARGDAAAEPALRIEYAVLAARWWPAYAARFSRGGTQVALQLDAFVAQASGEDWKDVRLALSTADLVQDTRLPELASLRLSRAQRPARRGYRPAPEGLDAMFTGFDRSVAALPEPAAQGTAASAALAPAHGASKKPRLPERSAHAEADLADTGATRRPPPPPAPLPQAPGMAPPPGVPVMVAALPAPAPARKSVGLPLPSFGGGGVPAPAPMAAPRGAPLAAQPAAFADRSRSLQSASGMAEEELGYAEAADGLAEAPAPLEPTDAWLDFDALHLPRSGPQRGRLVREGPGQARRAADQAQAAVDELEGPPRTVDPRASRGQFDHLYAGESAADVPSNGRLHRVALIAASAPSRPRFVTVPREAAEVYREARVENPFGVPLLAGPVEVFVDGALAAQSAIGHVDRGGVLRVGLGVEERIRVARNARVDESSAGLLGGSLAVEHAVAVDLSSSLGMNVEVEVIDRVPVTDDKDVEVKLLASQPRAEPYTQEDIGEPVRGGLRWRVPITAGGKASVAFTYRLVLASKNEIVGGNRRE